MRTKAMRYRALFAERSPPRCFASDFAIEIGVSIRQHPTGSPSFYGGSDHVRSKLWWRPVEPPPEAVFDPVAEVRDLAAAGAPGGDDRRGRRRPSGGSHDDHAHPHRRQGGRVGGAGRLQTGHGGPAARLRVGGRQGRERAAVRGAQGDGCAVDAGRGKRGSGLSGRVPHRVDAATKTALLHLLDDAGDAGWTLRRACHELELGEVRAHRWIARRALGQLADKTPGGSPMHGLLDAEAAEVLALFEEWGETDRSHRKLAHRGSYLHRVWVSPSSVRRVLFLADKHFRPLPKPGRSQRKPFPDWVDYKPNSIWIYGLPWY